RESDREGGRRAEGGIGDDRHRQLGEIQRGVTVMKRAANQRPAVEKLVSELLPPLRLRRCRHAVTDFDAPAVVEKYDVRDRTERYRQKRASKGHELVSRGGRQIRQQGNGVEQRPGAIGVENMKYQSAGEIPLRKILLRDLVRRGRQARADRSDKTNHAVPDQGDLSGWLSRELDGQRLRTGVRRASVRKQRELAGAHGDIGAFERPSEVMAIAHVKKLRRRRPRGSTADCISLSAANTH